MRMGRAGSGLALTVYFWTVVFFLTFPILIIVPISFSEGQFLRFPPESFGLRWYSEFFFDSRWTGAAIVSIRVAIMASLLATILGTMAAVALERARFAARTALMYLLTSPLVLPHIFIALGVFILAVHSGLDNNEIVLACAHATLAIPYVILIVGGALKQIDVTIERAARVLGAGPFRAFRAATLPSLLPSIAASSIFAFFVSFDELIISEFLLADRDTLPTRIWAELKLNISPVVAAVATMLIALTVLSLMFAEVLRRRNST